MAEVIDDRLAIRRTDTGEEVVVVDGARLVFGGGGATCQLVLQDADGRSRVIVNCETGVIAVKDGSGETRFRFAPDDGRIAARDASGQTRVRIAANRGRVVAFDPDGNPTALFGGEGLLRLGGAGRGGRIEILRDSGERSMLVDGTNGNLFLGGNGADGDLSLFPSDVTGDIGASSQPSIHLNGDSGDILLANADAAECFDVDGDEVEPGDVVVIENENRMTRSTRTYDSRVAGVVSGAGDLRPGIILNGVQRPGEEQSKWPVSLAGTVQCKVVADETPIRVGDLLTTSAVPGHAMRVVDFERAHGSVVGKAMAPAAGGCATVPILVALQ